MQMSRKTEDKVVSAVVIIMEPLVYWLLVVIEYIYSAIFGCRRIVDSLRGRK